MNKTGLKYDELSDESKKVVLNANREITTENQNWHEYILDEEKTKLETEYGFDSPKILYSGFWSQGDGASFTFDGCYPDFINSDLFTKNEHMLSGWDMDEQLKKFIENNISENGDMFYASSTRTGRYLHEKSVSYDVSCDSGYDMDTASHFDEVFSDWTCGNDSGYSIYKNLTQYEDAVMTTENSNMIYDIVVCVNDDKYLLYQNVNPAICDEAFEKFELIDSNEFATSTGFEEYASPDDFFNFEFTTKLNALIEHLGVPAVFDGCDSETLTFVGLIEKYDDNFINNLDAKLDDFVNVIERNLQQMCEGISREIYVKLENGYEHEQSDENVLDVLEINDFFGQTYNENGTVWLGGAPTFKFDELGGAGKDKARKAFFAVYEFESWEDVAIEQFKNKLIALGFVNPQFKFSCEDHNSTITWDKVDLKKAWEWHLEGIENAESIISVGQLDEDDMTIARNNYITMKEGLIKKFADFVYNRYAEQTTDEAIADYFDNSTFYADGTEINNDFDDE